MNSWIVFAVVIATAAAKPFGEQVISVSQDTLGNYDLKYAIDGISRVEQRNIHGDINGGYSYIDPHGVLRKITFTSGTHGFQAIGDIPRPVEDTPEVAIAKAQHLAILRAAELSSTPLINKVVEFPVETPAKLLELPRPESLISKVVEVPVAAPTKLLEFPRPESLLSKVVQVPAQVLKIPRPELGTTAFISKVVQVPTKLLEIPRSESLISKVLEVPVGAPTKLLEIARPESLISKFVELPLTAPTKLLEIARPESLISKVTEVPAGILGIPRPDLGTTSFITKIVEVPAKVLEIPRTSFIRTSPIEVVPVAAGHNVVRVGVIPESPEVLATEARKLAAYVGHSSL